MIKQNQTTHDNRPCQLKAVQATHITHPEVSQQIAADDRVLRLADVLARVGLSKSSIYAMIAKGDFPAGFPLGQQARGWLESSITQWIAGRVNSCREGGK